MAYDIFVQAIGFAGMAFCVASFQIKDSRRLIICQMLGLLLFVVQYILLGAFAGAAPLIVSVCSGLVISLQRYRWASWGGWRWVFVILTAAAWLFCYRRPVDFFVLLAQTAFILTTWSKNGRIIRLGKLTIVGVPWVIYAFLIHSYGAVLSELFELISTAISVRRYGWDALDQ